MPADDISFGRTRCLRHWYLSVSFSSISTFNFILHKRSRLINVSLPDIRVKRPWKYCLVQLYGNKQKKVCAINHSALYNNWGSFFIIQGVCAINYLCNVLLWSEVGKCNRDWMELRWQFDRGQDAACHRGTELRSIWWPCLPLTSHPATVFLCPTNDGLNSTSPTHIHTSPAPV